MQKDPTRRWMRRVRTAAAATCVVAAVSISRAESPHAAPDTFCIPEVTALGDDACYVLPDQPAPGPRTLLVYLHGILPPVAKSPIKTNFETVVKNGAKAAGVVALMPRGKRGLAPKTTPDWWGWPSTGDQYDRHGAALAQKIADTRAKLEEQLGRRFDRVYLAGSSSGAYFVSALALRGGFIADGYGVLSGGAPFYAPTLASLAPKPVYVGYGTYDTVGKACGLLVAQLKRAGWPVEVSTHPTGHGTRDFYLQEAFGFWAAAAR